MTKLAIFEVNYKNSIEEAIEFLKNNDVEPTFVVKDVEGYCDHFNQMQDNGIIAAYPFEEDEEE